MTREIKFRAWHELNEGMVYPYIRTFTDILTSGDILKRFDNVMQFTGLKDKNEKEIYEGDIVSIYDPYTKSQLITPVIWDDNNCRFAMKNTFMDFDFLVNDELEVIGNIYENPDLL